MREWKLFLRKLFEKDTTEGIRKEITEEKIITDYLFNQWNNVPEVYKDKKTKKRIWKAIMAECVQEYRRTIWGMQVYKFASIAATVFAILFAGMAILLTKQDVRYLISYAPEGEMVDVMLPDSSVIWLNSGTTIRYPENFAKNRQVELDGEAFFEVKKHEGTPFIVHFVDAQVEVKGTSFNIRSYAEMPVEILLVTGKIDFTTQKSRNVISLSPAEQLIYHPEDNDFIHKSVPDEYFDWRTGVYKFTDKPLDELVDIVRRIYDVEISIERQEHYQYTFTGSIKKSESLLDVIEKLSISLELEYRKDGNNIILY